ncbi:MAG: competence/damage-inducible protein A [Clostridia bacterium]|nr:competence/damage-inducible protein A [Clostridia bacterium]
MKGEILCVGTELLMGEVLNTNVQYLSQGLKQCGIHVYHHTTVGDNPERLREQFLQSLSRSDVVVLSGGLGPTGDDITKEVVADSLGLAQHTDSEQLQKIRGYFESIGREMTENNKKQAEIPETAAVLHNAVGTAPGIYIQKDGKHIFLLPGVPSEMRPMFDIQVRPVLCGFSAGQLVSHSVLIFGMGESAVDDRLQELMQGANPTVSPYCKTGEVSLRVASFADTKQEGEAACAQAIAEIYKVCGEYVVGVDVTDLQTVVVKLLAEKKLKLATAESCTGGLISRKLTEVSGASAVFDFGACVYANAMKQKLLGVSAETLQQYGAVSRQTAEEMAAGVCRYADAELGLSVTGVAGPGASENKPVGLIYIALQTPQKCFTKELKLFSKSYTRETIRELTAKHALDMVRRYLCFGNIE